MAGMLLVAKSVHNHVVDALQIVQFRVGNGFHIGDVGKVFNTETDDGQLSVHHTDGHNFDTPLRCIAFLFLEDS